MVDDGLTEAVIEMELEFRRLDLGCQQTSLKRLPELVCIPSVASEYRLLMSSRGRRQREQGWGSKGVVVEKQDTLRGLY